MSEEWTSDTAPQVPPDQKFRADLHRALEETHRRQRAQRQTELHADAWYTPVFHWRWLVLALLLTTLLATMVSGMWILRRRR